MSTPRAAATTATRSPTWKPLSCAATDGARVDDQCHPLPLIGSLLSLLRKFLWRGLCFHDISLFHSCSHFLLPVRRKSSGATSASLASEEFPNHRPATPYIRLSLCVFVMLSSLPWLHFHVAEELMARFHMHFS